MRWTYDEVGALPPDVYRVLVEELNREAAEQKARDDARERERKQRSTQF